MSTVCPLYVHCTSTVLPLYARCARARGSRWSKTLVAPMGVSGIFVVFFRGATIRKNRVAPVARSVGQSVRRSVGRSVASSVGRSVGRSVVGRAACVRAWSGRAVATKRATQTPVETFRLSLKRAGRVKKIDGFEGHDF